MKKIRIFSLRQQLNDKMMLIRFISLYISFFILQPTVKAFTLPSQRRIEAWASLSRDKNIFKLYSNPVGDLPEDRKANLFQCLIRDLEIEGCPVLGSDADASHTLQGSLWITIAQLSEQDEEGKACLVAPDMPVEALRKFVDDFDEMKTQKRLMNYLPELQRFSFSLLGKGVGPAIVIETAERSDEENNIYDAMIQSSPTPDELRWTAAMKSFNARVKLHGVEPGHVAYRFVASLDVCDIMTAFWSSTCELLATPSDQQSSIVLCLPPLTESSDHSESHKRFAVVSELISRSLFLYRGEDVFELMHMHPLYDRDLIHRKDKAAHGHLPPTGMVRSILRSNGNPEEAESLTDEQLSLHNYQRRSPVPAVVIKRVSSPDTVTTPSDYGTVKLDLEISSPPNYVQNTIRMAKEGEDALQSALDAEIELTK